MVVLRDSEYWLGILDMEVLLSSPFLPYRGYIVTGHVLMMVETGVTSRWSLVAISHASRRIHAQSVLSQGRHYTRNDIALRRYMPLAILRSVVWYPRAKLSGFGFIIS